MENIHYYINHKQKIVAIAQVNVQVTQANVTSPQPTAITLVHSVGSGAAASATVAAKANVVITPQIVATEPKVPIIAPLVLKIFSVLFVSLLNVLFKSTVSFISVSFVWLPTVPFNSIVSLSIVPLITVLLVSVLLLSFKIVVILSSKVV